MLSLSIAPLLHGGVEPLSALRIAIGVWGLLHLLACAALLRTLTDAWSVPHVLALCLVAVVDAGQAVSATTPDLALAACLTAYAAATLHKDLLSSRSVQVTCGMLGGLSYLAKSYALPFVIVHLACVVALRWWRRRQELPVGSAAGAWAAALAGCALLAAPWIAALSARYEKLTISTVARVAHTLTGPKASQRYQPLVGMLPVPEGRLYIWETPEALAYDHWNPLESNALFKHQVVQVAKTSKRILKDIATFDVLGLATACLVLAALLPQQGAEADCRPLWALATVGIYAAGLSFVFYERRYVLAFLWPVTIVYVVGYGWQRIALEVVAGRAPRTNAWLLSAIVVFSFAFEPAAWTTFLVSECSARQVQKRRESLDLARELVAAGYPGPLASAGDMGPGEGLYVAFHMRERYFGSPVATGVREVEQELADAGVRMFLVYSDWSVARHFADETHWKRLDLVPAGRQPVVYIAPTK